MQGVKQSVNLFFLGVLQMLEGWSSLFCYFEITDELTPLLEVEQEV